jgi:hypothetical protein
MSPLGLLQHHAEVGIQAGAGMTVVGHKSSFAMILN